MCDLFDADYGRSFYDVLQGVVNVSENLNSDKISSPSNFKYKVALENQVNLPKQFQFMDLHQLINLKFDLIRVTIYGLGLLDTLFFWYIL